MKIQMIWMDHHECESKGVEKLLPRDYYRLRELSEKQISICNVFFVFFFLGF